MLLSSNSDLGIRLTFSLILLGSHLKSFEGATRNVQNNKTQFGVSKSETEGALTLNGGQDLVDDYNDFESEEEMENDEEGDENDDDDGENEEEFDSKSLIEMVKNMEQEATEEPRTQPGILPKIYEYFSFASKPGEKKPTMSNFTKVESQKRIGSAYGKGNLPDDLSDKYFQDDVVDDIAAGIEESLVLSGGLNKNGNMRRKEAGENREYALYLFQGQYMVEPRLNRFIDGAIRNMVNEMKIEVMDPLYFRVLPRGQVVSRVKPRQGVKSNQLKLRPGRRRRRRRPFKRRKPGVRARRRKVHKRVPKTIRLPNRRGTKQKTANRNRGKQRKRKGQNRKRKQRNAIRGVGSGRVEGLSKIERDGDAEMQLFGNYTMIRSHQRIGPVVINMQFRTRRGLRSTGATLPDLKVHTVTRVSQSGSEMVDFVLDRPHPEIIQLRGKLFPLAERVAKNIFARLFLPGSFLVQRIREKVGVSLLSKPRIGNDGF